MARRAVIIAVIVFYCLSSLLRGDENQWQAFPVAWQPHLCGARTHTNTLGFLSPVAVAEGDCNRGEAEFLIDLGHSLM